MTMDVQSISAWCVLFEPGGKELQSVCQESSRQLSEVLGMQCHPTAAAGHASRADLILIRAIFTTVETPDSQSWNAGVTGS